MLRFKKTQDIRLHMLVNGSREIITQVAGKDVFTDQTGRIYMIIPPHAWLERILTKGRNLI